MRKEQHRGGIEACKFKVHRSKERNPEPGGLWGRGREEAFLHLHSGGTHTEATQCVQAQGCSPCAEPGHILCQALKAGLTNVQFIQQVAKSLLPY